MTMQYINNTLLANADPELKKFVLFLLEKLDQQAVQISELLQKNADLTARLNQTSRNSSLPPSRDGYRKVPKLIKKEGSKRQGGQIGHKGNTLHQVDNPDEIVACYPTKCTCGHEFSPHDTMIFDRKQQVFEIPLPKIHITEYQLFGCTCPKCGQITQGESPPNVTAPVQYGDRAKSLVVLLNNEFKLPVEKNKQLFDILYGCPMNEAVVIKTLEKFYEKLTPTEEIIKETLKTEAVGHVDETGIRIKKKLNWLHNFSTPYHTYLFVHPKRGKEAIASELSIIPDFNNWLMHDCLPVYFNFSQAKHALCNAHILRELQAIIDNDDKGTSFWAKQMQDYLLKLHGMDFAQRMQNQLVLNLEYSKICRDGLASNPPAEKVKGKRGRPKKTKARNLLHRLIKYKHSILAFAYNEHVPFTNNQAERDLRPAKIKLKISNSFRSDQGAKHYARIQSFISTARKNQKNILTEIYNTFQGNNFITNPVEFFNSS